MKNLILAVILLACVAPCIADDEPPLDQCMPDSSHETFRLFQTRNIWTLLKLDTRTGFVWQVQWGDNAVTLPINLEVLVPKGTAAKPAVMKEGRFTLCTTRNIYNFLLLDQTDGRVWDVQWSTDDKKRGISPVG